MSQSLLYTIFLPDTLITLFFLAFLLFETGFHYATLAGLELPR